MSKPDNPCEFLGLAREPFSTSPDPEFFYRSIAHQSALQRLESSVRSKRGLSLILGDVGTGKTTLCRTLLQSLETDEFVLHMILNPKYDSEFQFLNALCRICHVTPAFRSSLDCLEAIQGYLIQKGIEEGKTVVLLIDEGQNLTTPIVENLRTLLNFETNQFKLLQLVIMAQMEFLPRISRMKNFMDRVAVKYVINPFGLEETRSMIQYRLQKAGYFGSGLFTDGAIEAIYHRTQGYPRQVTILCHNVLETLAMKRSSVADAGIVEETIREMEPDYEKRTAESPS